MTAEKYHVLLWSVVLPVILSVVWPCGAWAGRGGKAVGPANKQTAKTVSGDEWNTAAYKQLEQAVDLSAWTVDTPLSEAVELLRNSVEPKLKIVVLWGQLGREAFIGRDTPIYLDGISGIRLDSALRLLLLSVSEADVPLGYYVDHGVIIITTKESLRKRAMVMRVYNVSELTILGGGMDFGTQLQGGLDRGGSRHGGGLGTIRTRGGTSRSQTQAEQIAKLIKETINPDSWKKDY